MHVLEAGYETPGRPGILLIHGFPELAYSWRKVMLPLAQAGFRVIAPDQRGYGQTSGWDGSFDGDVRSFRPINLVQDAVALVFALGLRKVQSVVGHDFGSSVAAWCALIRPDIFCSVVMMSAPFGGPPTGPPMGSRLHDELAALTRPRKHYQWYYSTPGADRNMRNATQGIHAFMRAYYHHKSADWRENKPFALKDASAIELARMPTYYLMDLHQGMAETVASEMPDADAIANCRWLPDDELAIYSASFARTGFQGALNWYRCSTSEEIVGELKVFSGRTIDVPSCFLAGINDWGVYQKPGVFEAMQSRACTRMVSCDLVEGAGHWVQQEKPEAVARLLLTFLSANHVT
jgi:pimeloyl-ACP methyl ester carboxylesterase